jgi:hypothetical protein
MKYLHIGKGCFQIHVPGFPSLMTSTKMTFCTHNLESDASNIQRSLRNECFPIDSNVKVAKNTGPLRHSKKNIGLDNNKILFIKYNFPGFSSIKKLGKCL